LFINYKSDYKTIDNGISLLEANIRKIYRALDNFIEKIGIRRKLGDSGALTNVMLTILHKISMQIEEIAELIRESE
jgi:hypothetical protein